MAWGVEYTDQFGNWFENLDEDQQESVVIAVEVFQGHGPGLGRPLVDTIKGSRHANMKESGIKTSFRSLTGFTMSTWRLCGRKDCCHD
jgi:hypothetical protein